MKFIFFSLLFQIVNLSVSIYSFSITNAEGGQIRLSDFQNRKILFVNIATGSEKEGQLGELQKLQQQFGNKLVIIAFPTNSFGHEARTDAGILQFCKAKYGVNYLVAKKSIVNGNGIHPVYSWLTRKTENGLIDAEIKGDFQKFIIDEKGEISGVFAGEVRPLDQQIIKALKSSSN